MFFLLGWNFSFNMVGVGDLGGLFKQCYQLCSWSEKKYNSDML